MPRSETSASGDAGSDTATSRRLGALIGPSLMAIIASELPFVQPRLYAEQTAPVVYLSGTLLFIAGLATVRAHNRWVGDWTALITLTGWAALGLGLVRMFAASTYRAGYSEVDPVALLAFECTLFTVGAVITFASYRRGAG